MIKQLLHSNRIEKILLVDNNYSLTGLVTLKDINKSLDFPNATKDSEGRLLVGAAVGTDKDSRDRAAALIEAGVDVLVVDSAHGHAQGVLSQVQFLKKEFKVMQGIGGNVATPEGAWAVAKVGANAVKVGIGPGSNCTTRIITGVGVPQITAVANAVEALKSRNIPVIADGGIRFSGDVAKAIAAGAHSVMLGSVLAGTEEAPGDVETALESELLQLNCEKARQYLNWSATLSFEETVQMTTDWYKKYYESHLDICKVTLEQIKIYETLFQERNST